MKATTKRLLAMLLCGAMALGMTACGGNGDKDAAADTGAGDAAADAGDDAAAAGAVTINVGYENAVTEPAAKACEKWKELVEEKSGGSIKLELPELHPGQEERPDRSDADG